MQRLKRRRRGRALRLRVRDGHVIGLDDSHRRRGRLTGGRLMRENRRHRQRLFEIDVEIITEGASAVVSIVFRHFTAFQTTPVGVLIREVFELVLVYCFDDDRFDGRERHGHVGEVFIEVTRIAWVDLDDRGSNETFERTCGDVPLWV